MNETYGPSTSGGISQDIPPEVLVSYVSFISAPRCFAAAAGLLTPLRPSPDDRLVPLLSLRHRQTTQARPPAPKLLQPWVDLVDVAPPTAIHSGSICDPVLKRAGLEVPQVMRYGRSSVALQETGKEWHPAKHKFAGGDVQDRTHRNSGRLVQLGHLGQLQLRIPSMAREGPDQASQSSSGWVQCSAQVSINQDIPFAKWDNLG